MSDEPARRIDGLEEALAHHEAMVHDLSDELAKQWRTIEVLSRRLKEMEEKIATLGPPADAPGPNDPPPPHY